MRRNTPLPMQPGASRPEPTVRSVLVAALLPVAFLAVLAAPGFVVAALLGALSVPTWRRVRGRLQRSSERQGPETRPASPAGSR